MHAGYRTALHLSGRIVNTLLYHLALCSPLPPAATPAPASTRAPIGRHSGPASHPPHGESAPTLLLPVLPAFQLVAPPAPAALVARGAHGGVRFLFAGLGAAGGLRRSQAAVDASGWQTQRNRRSLTRRPQPPQPPCGSSEDALARLVHSGCPVRVLLQLWRTGSHLSGMHQPSS